MCVVLTLGKMLRQDSLKPRSPQVLPTFTGPAAPPWRESGAPTGVGTINPHRSLKPYYSAVVTLLATVTISHGRHSHVSSDSTVAVHTPKLRSSLFLHGPPSVSFSRALQHCCSAAQHTKIKTASKSCLGWSHLGLPIRSHSSQLSSTLCDATRKCLPSLAVKS